MAALEPRAHLGTSLVGRVGNAFLNGEPTLGLAVVALSEVDAPKEPLVAIVPGRTATNVKATPANLCRLRPRVTLRP